MGQVLTQAPPESTRAHPHLRWDHDGL